MILSAEVRRLRPAITASPASGPALVALDAPGSEGPSGPPGQDADTATYTFAIAISAPGQTTIPLPVPPSRLSSVTLTVNGLAYRAPNLGVSDVAVTWLNPAFRLDPQDDVVLTYS